MSIPTSLISLFPVARLHLLQPFPQRYTVKEAGEPVELARNPLAQCDSETLHHASQGKEAEPSGCNPDPTQCESEAMLHFLITLVAQSQERRTSNAEDPGGSPGGGATLGVTVIATANPCKIQRAGAIPSISTRFPSGGSACHIGCVR